MKRHILLVALLSVISFIFLTADATHAITLSASPNPAAIGQNVTATVTATYPTSAAPCGVQIRFAATETFTNLGSCSTPCNIAHVYSSPGLYIVTVQRIPSIGGCASAFPPSPVSTSVTVNCPALSITSPSTLSSGTVGSGYTYQVTTSGGQAPVSFSIVGGSLPAGLGLSPTGLITGTPSSSGTSTFTVRATDSCGTGVQTFDKSLSITVNPAPCSALSITSPSTLSTGTVNQFYSYQLTTSGGQAPVSFSIVGGSLPAGLGLSPTGLITGTPSSSGTSTFTVRATDSCGTGVQTADKSLSITVNPAPCPALSITSPSTLSTGTVNQFYSYQLTTSGGQAPVSFSIVGGSLPGGLGLSPTGLITGTPSSSGTSTFTVRATDSCGTGVQTADKSLSITVNPAACTPLSITSPSTLPSGTVGQGYSYQITTSGGQSPITFSFLSDTYPPGLTMSPTGFISGTPKSSGSYSFTIRTTDGCAAGAQSVQNDFSITVQSIPPPVTISVNPLPPSFRIPRGYSSSNSVLYQFTGSASINTTLVSSAGNFMVGSEIIETNAIPLRVQIQNGSGRVSEVINIPVAVIERALRRGANTFIYVRNFIDVSINVTATVNFMITTEAGADFEIKRLDLYFENRRPEITVNRGFPKLMAFADIRFVGSGFLQGYWEVDGRMLSHVDQHLAYGASVTLQTPDIPPLPTFDTGSHVVRFVITNPATNLQLPSIIFFVTAEEGQGKPVNIVLLSPVNYSLIEYAPVRFEWEKLDKTPLYFIRFYDKPESVPVFSAYAKEAYYTLPDIALKGIFSPGQKYFWKVTAFDAENKVIGESETWNFTFALEKGKLQGIVVNKK